MSETITFKDAIREVGEWSRKNFGDQGGAGALAPLAGIVEEIGEGVAAWTDGEIVDAYVDQLVFLADVCYRAGIEIDPDWNDELRIGENNLLSTALGALAHALLKRRQGIRGFDNHEKFRKAAEGAALRVFYAVNAAFNEESYVEGEYDISECFASTWNEVKQRDWTKNPKTAHQVVNEAVDQLKDEQPFG